MRWILWLCLLTVLCSATAAQTPATTETEAASAEDIERVIDTLRDSGAREELISDLETLREARRGDEAQEERRNLDVWQWVTDRTEHLWQQLVNIDPAEVLTGVLLTLAIVLAALLVRILVLRLLRRLYNRLSAPAEEGSDERDLPQILRRVVSGIIGIVVIVSLAWSWGADVGAALESDTGARLLQTLLSIGLILIATLLLWHATNPFVERMLRLYSRNMRADRRDRRLGTLVPLIGTVLRVTIGLIATLLVLSELGIDIGPLLAGAGILGLAVGFGAQTLVKDLITGAIILLEDSASTGDVVETGGHIGVVESMRVRVLQLRDLHGTVYVIPYSEVTTIKNYTKDYSYYLFDIGVAYREDTDEVVSVLEELAEEFRNDPGYRDMVLEPLEVLGVNAFADSAVIIRVRFKTRPGDQWTVGRAFNRRIKKRFDELDIEIPFPHTTVYFGASKTGEAQPVSVALLDDQGGEDTDEERNNERTRPATRSPDKEGNDSDGEQS